MHKGPESKGTRTRSRSVGALTDRIVGRKRSESVASRPPSDPATPPMNASRPNNDPQTPAITQIARLQSIISSQAMSFDAIQQSREELRSKGNAENKSAENLQVFDTANTESKLLLKVMTTKTNARMANAEAESKLATTCAKTTLNIIIRDPKSNASQAVFASYFIESAALGRVLAHVAKLELEMLQKIPADQVRNLTHESATNPMMAISKVENLINNVRNVAKVNLNEHLAPQKNTQKAVDKNSEQYQAEQESKINKDIRQADLQAEIFIQELDSQLNELRNQKSPAEIYMQLRALRQGVENIQKNFAHSHIDLNTMRTEATISESQFEGQQRNFNEAREDLLEDVGKDSALGQIIANHDPKNSSMDSVIKGACENELELINQKLQNTASEDDILKLSQTAKKIKALLTEFKEFVNLRENEFLRVAQAYFEQYPHSGTEEDRALYATGVFDSKNKNDAGTLATDYSQQVIKTLKTKPMRSEENLKASELSKESFEYVTTFHKSTINENGVTILCQLRNAELTKQSNTQYDAINEALKQFTLSITRELIKNSEYSKLNELSDDDIQEIIDNKLEAYQIKLMNNPIINQIMREHGVALIRQAIPFVEDRENKLKNTPNLEEKEKQGLQQAFEKSLDNLIFQGIKKGYENAAKARNDTTVEEYRAEIQGLAKFSESDQKKIAMSIINTMAKDAGIVEDSSNSPNIFLEIVASRNTVQQADDLIQKMQQTTEKSITLPKLPEGKPSDTPVKYALKENEGRPIRIIKPNRPSWTKKAPEAAAENTTKTENTNQNARANTNLTEDRPDESTNLKF